MASFEQHVSLKTFKEAALPQDEREGTVALVPAVNVEKQKSYSMAIIPRVRPQKRVEAM